MTRYAWALWAGLALQGCATPGAPEPVEFTVLHTNDHHGRFWRGAGGEHGLAARAALVRAVREEVAREGGHVLLLDAGDVNTGTPESDLLRAEPDFRGMSELRYDAMAVGNHEFDRPPATQHEQRWSWSSFPWLSANVTRGGQPAFEPYRLLRLGALRVAILGLTTEDTRLMAVADRYPDLRFEPAQDAARRWMPELRRQADVVIALTHLGHYTDGRHGSSAPGDVELARAVPGIDLIVGGHTHTLVCMIHEALRRPTYEPEAPCKPDRHNGAWIVQAGEHGRFVGRADFRWDQGRLELRRYTLLPVNLGGSTRWAEDAAVLALLATFQARAQQGMDVVLAHAHGRFEGDRSVTRWRQTALGQLVTAGMREATQADVAVISSGGLRATLPAGELTLRDVLTLLPFRNTLVTVNMTGLELAQYLQAVLSFSPGSGAYAQLSGAQQRPGGKGPWWVAGKPLQDNAIYRLVVPSFVAGGGDGYPDLRAHLGYAHTGLLDSDALRSFIERRRTLDPADFAPPTGSGPAP